MSSVESLELALKMEQEGREFYLKAGQKSQNQLGQRLFLALADAELEHMEKIKQIHAALKKTSDWPEGTTSFARGRLPRTIFADALDNMGRLVKVTTGELEAYQTGMNLENKSLLFYLDLSGKAAPGAERQFYQALVAEERGHYLLLFDSYEYLLDPQAFFIRKEHHGLDAGG